jgi:hypothetical protein
MTSPLEPNDLSHLSDEEFLALCPQGFHGTGDFAPLSPAANAILDAYFTHADLLNREVSHEEMIAAAFRELANQAAPRNHIKDISYIHQNYVDGWIDALDVILAIATSLSPGND